MRMNIRPLALGSPLLLLACSMGPFSRSAAHDPQAQRGLAEALFQKIQCDGETLSGRLLLSATATGLLLDKRLIETAYLTTESVSACETGQPLPFVVMDVYAKPPSQEDLLLLKPGYWYGKDVHIPLFTKGSTGAPSPACINVELAFRALDGASLAPLRLQAQCTSDTHGSPEAGSRTDAEGVSQ
jgi:hypothetical protein